MEAKRPTRWWLGWIVAILIVLVTGVLGSSVVKTALGNPVDGPAKAQCIEVATNGLAVIVLGLWVVLKEGRPFGSIGFRGRNKLGRFLIGLLIGAGMMAVGVIVLLAIGQYADGESAHGTLGMAALGTVLMLVVVWIVQGTAEEVTVRGYMLQVGGVSLPAWVAILGSAVVFAVAHLNFEPLPLLNTILFAVFACFVALGQGSLWLIAGIHVGWNYLQGNVFGVPVSGTPRDVSIWAVGPTPGSSNTLRRPERCRDRSSSGMTRSTRSRRRTSVPGIPNMFSAAGFQYSTHPVTSMMTTASMADARIAEVKAVSCGAEGPGGMVDRVIRTTMELRSEFAG